MCNNFNYTTPNNLDILSLINNIDSERLIQQAHYERSSHSSNLNKLLEEQQILLSNRSFRVKSLLKQIDSLITATKEGTSLFGDISNLLLNLLPTSWATTIKNIILIFALIISLPIIFFIILISIRCLRLLVWCYRPICHNCLSSYFRFISLTSYLFSKVSQLFSRNKLGNAGQQPEVGIRYSALLQDEVAVKLRTNRPRSKKATFKIF